MNRSGLSYVKADSRDTGGVANAFAALEVANPGAFRLPRRTSWRSRRQQHLYEQNRAGDIDLTAGFDRNSRGGVATYIYVLLLVQLLLLLPLTGGC